MPKNIIYVFKEIKIAFAIKPIVKEINGANQV